MDVVQKLEPNGSKLTVIALAVIIGSGIALAVNMLYGHAHDGTDVDKEHFVNEE